MVLAVKPEEWDMARKAKRDPHVMTDFDKGVLLGARCRITIDFSDVMALRKTAELLAGYAELMRFYTRRTDLPPRAILFHLLWEAKMLQGKLSARKGPGRPPKLPPEEHNT